MNFIAIIIMLLLGVLNALSDKCDNVTDLHWKLFFKANIFTNYIQFDDISETKTPVSSYLEKVMQVSYKKFQSPLLIFKLDPKYEDPVYDFLELFSWSGAKLPLRDSQLNKTFLIHNAQQLSGLQKDESNFLIFVMVQSIDVLERYIHGPARKPFQKTRGRYIVIIKEEYNEYFEKTAAKILRRLWEDHGLLRVLIMSSCQDEHFYEYDPFTRTEYSSNSTDTEYSSNSPQNLDNWGTVHKVNFNDENAIQRWHHTYAFTYGGYPMTSVMFHRLPTAIRWCELPEHFRSSYFCDARFHSTVFGGVDGIILGILMKTLNFTPFTFEPVGEYGYQLDNGSYLGSIADVLYSRAGLSSNGRFVQDYGTTEIEFLYPIFFDRFCIISPKAQQIPQWLAVFRCFSPWAWALIIFSNSALGCVWYLFKKWTKHIYKSYHETRLSNETFSPIHDKISVSIIDMWLLMTSGMPSILPYQSVERLFITGCLLLSLTISGTFQGSLTTSYSTKSYYKDINTLKELDESGYAIGSSSRNLANIFESEGNPVFESLERKFTIRPQPTIDRAAFKRDTCAIERASDIKVIITINYELADGSPLLHVVEECPRSYYLSFIVRKGWPFLNRFNDILMRLSESGLLYEWYEQVESAIILSNRLKRLKQIDETLQAFNIQDMQTVFYILLIGSLICIIIFGIEVHVGRKLLQTK